jgi:hypothetical protein
MGIIGVSMKEESSKRKQESGLIVAQREQSQCRDTGSEPTTHIRTSLPIAPMFALAAVFKAQHVIFCHLLLGALCFCKEPMGIEEMACQVPYFIYNSLPPIVVA